MPRQTIGDNPLDGLIPDKRTAAATKASHRDLEPAGTTQRPEPVQRIAKERLTVHVSVDVVNRVKNAVYWTPGLTLAALSEEAFTKEVDALEKKRGESFSPRMSRLRGGRPVK